MGKSVADEVVLDYFGSLGTTVLTLFMSISGGLDWGECLQSLRDLHWLYAPFFAVWVGFASFSVVGVLTAVIIEASSRILHVDKDLVIEQIVKEDNAKEGYLRQLFRDMDLNNKGSVTAEELNNGLQSERVLALLKSLDLCISRTQKLFQFLDADGSGLVEINEFVEGLMKCRGVAIIVDENQRLTECLCEEFVKLRTDLQAAAVLAPSGRGSR